MRIAYPIILHASTTAGEARAALDADDVKEFRSAVVRAERGHQVVWHYFDRVALRQELAHAEDTERIGKSLSLKDRKGADVIRAEDLLHGDQEGPKVVMLGSRLFGVVEQKPGAALHQGQVRSANRGAAPPAPAAPRAQPIPGSRAAVQPPSARVRAAAFVEAPSAVKAEGPFQLKIGLSDLAGGQAIAGVVDFTVPAGEDSIAMGLEILAPGFTCNQGWRHTLTIDRNDPFTARCNLSLTAPSLPDDVESRACSILVFYSYRGQPSGVGTRAIVVQNGSAQNVGAPANAAPSLIRVNSDAPPIDLTVRITWRDNNEGTNLLDWSFESPHTTHAPVSKTLVSSGTAGFARRLLQVVTTNDGRAGIDLLVKGIGAQIATVVPSEVWTVLRDVHAKVRASRGDDAVPTVLLATQESQVPWELACIPDPVPDAARPPFLSTQFIVSRWVLETDGRNWIPPHSLDVDDMAVIVGEYTAGGDFRPLPNALLEAETLKNTYGAERFTATREAVLGVLLCELPQLAPERAGVEAIHFACHGEVEQADMAAAALILNDGTSFPPEMFLAAEVAKRRRPFIFLNACQLGAAAPSLGLYSGFAGMCVRAGFSGVIAPLWSVNDVVAHDLAMSFYQKTLKPAPGQQRPSVAAVFHELKQKHLAKIKVKVKQADGSVQEEERDTATPLAYIVYGHPGLVLQRT